RSPPSPVAAPPVLVAIRCPLLLLSNRSFVFWSGQSSNTLPHKLRYHSDSINLRHLTESRCDSDNAYDEKSQRCCGNIVHSHAGQNTPTARLFMCLGGMLISKFRMPLLSVIACK